MIGPWSSAGVTKCTVQPCVWTPFANAWACVCKPGKAGKRDGVGEDSEHQERAEYAVVNGQRQHMGFVVGFVGVVRHDDSS